MDLVSNLISGLISSIAINKFIDEFNNRFNQMGSIKWVQSNRLNLSFTRMHMCIITLSANIF